MLTILQAGSAMDKAAKVGTNRRPGAHEYNHSGSATACPNRQFAWRRPGSHAASTNGLIIFVI